MATENNMNQTVYIVMTAANAAPPNEGPTPFVIGVFENAKDALKVVEKGLPPYKLHIIPKEIIMHGESDDEQQDS